MNFFRSRLLLIFLFALNARSFAQTGPDLVPNPEALLSSFQIVERVFLPNACSIQEGCLSSPGFHRLLTFDVEILNTGTEDLVLGPPTNDPRFHFSPCHGHHHLPGWAIYRLYRQSPEDPDGERTLLASTGKAGFCLMDTHPFSASASSESRFNCGFQGLSRGWTDVYDRELDCQWVEITNLEPGQYILSIEINSTRSVQEADFTNNVTEIPVWIPEN